MLKSFTKLSFLTVLLLILLSHQQNAHAFVNYTNHPDLTKAMEFNLATNYGNREKADSAKAEFYYLRYLEDVNDSFQRARVYSHIGRMWATGFNHYKGEKRDINKAREYSRKVLECEPERIGTCTIVARNLLTTLENPLGIERMKARVAMYEWLSKLDKETIQKNFLPERPPLKKDELKKKRRFQRDPNVPTPQDLKGLSSLIDSLKEGAIYNAAVCDAMSMKVPEQGFMYILEHLPEDAPEKKMVREIMQKRVDRIADNGMRDLFKNFTADINNASFIYDSNEIIVNHRFIPHIDFAKKNNTPFIYDFQTGKFIQTPLEDKFDNEKLYNHLEKLGKGDIAWNGNLLTTRKATLSTAPQEAKHPLKIVKGKFSNSYKLPDEVSLPYTMIVCNKEGKYFLSQILEITPDGITIFSRDLSTAELPRYILKEKE